MLCSKKRKKKWILLKICNKMLSGHEICDEISTNIWLVLPSCIFKLFFWGDNPLGCICRARYNGRMATNCNFGHFIRKFITIGMKHPRAKMKTILKSVNKMEQLVSMPKSNLEIHWTRITLLLVNCACSCPEARLGRQLGGRRCPRQLCLLL